MRAVAALLLMCCAGCAGTGLLPEAKTFRHADPVAPLGENVAAGVSVLNPDKQVYENEPLVIELKLANISASDVNINNDLQPGRQVVIEILSAHGEYRRSPELARGQTLQDEYRYMTLPPGTFVGRQYQIWAIDPAWNLADGLYSIRVVYRNSQRYAVASSLLNEADIRQLGQRSVVALLTGTAVSNVERFKIVSGKR